MKASSNKKYTFAVGRRKTSTARVRLFKGSEKNLINGKEITITLVEKPLKITDLIGKYYFTSKVTGGGVKSQLEATVHGVSRAIALVNPEKFRVLLKKEGLLERDSRERQRRMVGTGGKSRRKKQSPKR